MDCPNCGSPMQKHIASNGQVFWKCENCGHVVDTPDLDIQLYERWEVKDEV